MLKCAKNYGNWFRHFEDMSRRCEPSNVVAYRNFLAHPVYTKEVRLEIKPPFHGIFTQ